MLGAAGDISAQRSAGKLLRAERSRAHAWVDTVEQHDGSHCHMETPAISRHQGSCLVVGNNDPAQHRIRAGAGMNSATVPARLIATQLDRGPVRKRAVRLERCAIGHIDAAAILTGKIVSNSTA